MATLQRDAIERIVHAASLAPSAENNQPWRFHAHGDQIRVYLDKRRALGSDVDHMFDLTAIGAAIENASIAARQENLELQVSVLIGRPEGQADDRLLPVAVLTAQTGSSPDPLHPFLEERCTCRTLAPREAVSAAGLRELADAAAAFPGVRVQWITRREQIEELSQLVALGDRIRFEFPPFQNEFFENLRFTAREVEAARDGLDVRTLELPPGGPLVLQLLRHLWILRAGNKVGLSRLLVGPAQRWVLRAPVIGLLVIEKSHPKDFLNGGRALERLWLSATSIGLGLHPIGSLPIFMAYAERTDGALLSARHLEWAKAIAARVRQLEPALRRGVIQLAFRVGVPRLPRIRSLRLPDTRILRLESSAAANV